MPPVCYNTNMKISGIKLRLDEEENKLYDIAKKKFGRDGFFRILKKSLDARDKGNIFYVCSVEISGEPFVSPSEFIGEYCYPENPVAVVGFGPAGIFCALRLARAGFRPIIIERGQDADERKKTVNRFFTSRELDTECNIQYGEGGAGAFSDGKLNTGVRSEYKDYVLSELIKHGAPEEIAYSAKPHIGSDILPGVVKAIREEIIDCGGKFLFNTAVVDIETEGEQLKSLKVKKRDYTEKIEVSAAVFAIGHSSRDTYEMLFAKGIAMEAKDCAVGFRIEHLQEDINKAQFGRDIGVTADYKLTSSVCDRGVFTFCMCPGGTVVPAASEENALVTNGMSEYKRDKTNANSAVVCQVKTSDYGSRPLDGIDYLRSIEKRAFVAGGGDYSAPVQNVADFMRGRKSVSFGRVKPSYCLGTKFCNLEDIVPDYISCSVRKSLADMEKRLKGFASSGVLTAAETRTSSPVRILRNDKLVSLSVSNLYPAGEVGYAGGIMSSAMDGIKVAEKIKEKYSAKN